jgi:hypothetical protein
MLSGGRSPRSARPIHKFMPIEDARLVQLVGLFGEDDWDSIAQNLPNRTVRQCRERWLYFLAPSIVNGPWSPEEDALLWRKFREFGSKWKQMTKFFPGRTEINIKNRHAALRRRQAAHPAALAPCNWTDVVILLSNPNPNSMEQVERPPVPCDSRPKEELTDGAEKQSVGKS